MLAFISLSLNPARNVQKFIEALRKEKKKEVTVVEVVWPEEYQARRCFSSFCPRFQMLAAIHYNCDIWIAFTDLDDLFFFFLYPESDERGTYVAKPEWFIVKALCDQSEWRKASSSRHERISHELSSAHSTRTRLFTLQRGAFLTRPF